MRQRAIFEGIGKWLSFLRFDFGLKQSDHRSELPVITHQLFRIITIYGILFFLSSCTSLSDLMDPPISDHNYEECYGDILVETSSNSEMHQSPLSSESLSYSYIRLWPDGKIHYFFRSEISTFEQLQIREAMDAWESVTPVRFIESEHGGDYIYIIEKDPTITFTSASTLGYRRHAALKIKNINYKLALHELGHCLGLKHEHQRPDRDNHITILWENIPDSIAQAFYIDTIFINEKEINTSEIYDYDSIMHYKDTYQGKTIIDTHGHKTGHNANISPLDAAAVSALYNNPAKITPESPKILENTTNLLNPNR